MGIDFAKSLGRIGVFFPFDFDEGDDGWMLEEIEEFLGGGAVMELELSANAEPEEAARAFGDDGDAAGFGNDLDGESGVGRIRHGEGEWIHWTRFL